MKRFMVILFVLLLVGLIAMHANSQDKLFRVKVQIEYDGLTSYQAAEVEKSIQQIKKYNAEGKEIKMEYRIELKAK